MIQRNEFSTDFREEIVLKIVSGQSSLAQISKREGTSSQTNLNWKHSLDAGSFQNENETELALRKRTVELESTLAESALTVHIQKDGTMPSSVLTRSASLEISL